MRQGKRHITYDSTNQLVSAANAQTYALSVTYGDWGKIQQYGLQQTDLASNTTTSQTRYYSYGSLNEGQTAFAPNSINYADGTNVNEQYGIGGSLQRRETTAPGNQPNEELYRFGADGNLRMYCYDRLFFALYGYDAANTRTFKYSMDLSPNWVNGRLESVNFNMHTAMFYPNSYLNFNNNGYYTKHYYNGMERIASRLGDQNISINVNDPELQDRKDQLDSNIRRNIVDITGYEFLPVGEEQNPEDPKPVFELLVIGLNNLQPSADGIFYYHLNHLGSTCYVTDGNASVQQGFLYAPFGEITNEYNNSFGSSVLPKYSFNAKELDEETGMYYYEARYYAPPTFISRDPLFEKYPTFSPYAYCANNPVNVIDPDGRDWYKSEDGSFVIWQEGNAENIEYEGVKYTNIGETYKGLTINFYELYDGYYTESLNPAIGLTIDITYNYNLEDENADVRWVQTVLNSAGNECNVEVPYIDPCTNNDNYPFYYTDSELKSKRSNGVLSFNDIPTRPKEGEVWWRGELSVVRNNGYGYEPIITMCYGFKMDNNENKTVTLYPIYIAKPCNFTINKLKKCNNNEKKQQ